jgi:rod shape-determining protein MreD
MGRHGRIDNRVETRTQGPGYGHGIRLGVRVFLLAILQVSVMPRLAIFGATPDILLAYITVIAVTGRQEGRWKTAAISGIAAGFLADTLGGVGIGVLTMFYFAVGVLVSHLMRRFQYGFLEELLLFMAAIIPASILRGGVTLLYALLSGTAGFEFGVFFFGTLLPEVLGTLLFSIPIFLLFRGRD